MLIAFSPVWLTALIAVIGAAIAVYSGWQDDRQDGLHFHQHTHHTVVNVTVVHPPPTQLTGATHEQAQLPPAQVMPLLTAPDNRVMSMERQQVRLLDVGHKQLTARR